MGQAAGSNSKNTSTGGEDAMFNGIKVSLNMKDLYLQNEADITLEPFTYHDAVYLPLEAVAKAIGFHVKWDNGVMVIGKDAPSDKQTEGMPPTSSVKSDSIINENHIKITVNGNSLIAKKSSANTPDTVLYQGTIYKKMDVFSENFGGMSKFSKPSNNTHLVRKRF